jgi:hypothetical protein
VAIELTGDVPPNRYRSIDRRAPAIQFLAAGLADELVGRSCRTAQSWSEIVGSSRV